MRTATKKTRTRNMTKRTFLIMVATLAALQSKAQLTLGQCLDMAHDNYPTVKQYRLTEQSREYTVANAAKSWLPKVSMSAGAYMFTDMVEMPKQAATAFGEMKNELYNVSVSVSQTLYDGGETASRKRTAHAMADVERKQTDVSMYDINGRVEELFFGILTIDEQLKQNRLLQDDLGIGLQTVEGMIRGGMANQTDADAVRVEIVKARQQENGMKASRKAFTKMLSTFTGHSMDETTTLERPVEIIPAAAGEATNRRPEMDYYSAQLRLLDEQRRSLDTRLMPRLDLFGTGIYHNKIVGMAKNGTLAAGITMKWNIGALYTRKNDIRNIDTERQSVETQREAFVFNTRLKEENSHGNIENLRKQIELDDEIIRLRENIRSKSEKRVRGGTETVNEMLRDINAVGEARQAKAIHTVLLLKETYALKNTTNQ